MTHGHPEGGGTLQGAHCQQAGGVVTIQNVWLHKAQSCDFGVQKAGFSALSHESRAKGDDTLQFKPHFRGRKTTLVQQARDGKGCGLRGKKGGNN